jgi:hypothetical protein
VVPAHQLAVIADVGAYAAFLTSSERFSIAAGAHEIDGGYHITG